MQAKLKRWWVYQQERFPIFKNGLLIAVFSISAVCHSVLLRARSLDPLILSQVNSLWQIDGFSLLSTVGAALLGFIVVFLFFLQLRIADEFKDAEEDFRYRPYRPVPRGLVSLKELGMVAIASAVIQFGLTLAINIRLLGPLVLVWSYMALMTKEFFQPNWLKVHPFVYMISHMLVMPLIGFYATACDWLHLSTTPPQGIIWYLLVSFFGGMAIEIGRKIRAPKDEERGVETYTSKWGREKAIMMWLGSLWFTTLATLLAALYIRFTLPVALLLILLLTMAVVVSWRFNVYPITRWARRFELVSGVWTLLVYFSLGLLPLLLY